MRDNTAWASYEPKNEVEERVIEYVRKRIRSAKSLERRDPDEPYSEKTIVKIEESCGHHGRYEVYFEYSHKSQHCMLIRYLEINGLMPVGSIGFIKLNRKLIQPKMSEARKRLIKDKYKQYRIKARRVVV